MVAIMGPSGSGKSTLLHLLGALETPTCGEIALAGQRYDGLGDAELTLLRRDRIGFVFQFFNLLPALSAEENVLLPALIAGRRDDATRERGARCCSSGSASGARSSTCPRSSPAASSSGSRSPARCSRSRSWCSPTSRPATSTRARAPRCSSCCASSTATEGQTIVMVTHDPSAAAIAERVIFLRDGRVAGELEGGSPSGSSTASPGSTATSDGARDDGRRAGRGPPPARRRRRPAAALSRPDALVRLARAAPGPRPPAAGAADRRRDRPRRRR